MKPIAINERGIKIFSIKDGKAKWQKGTWGKVNTSNINFIDGLDFAESAYFNAYGTKQFLCKFYKIKS
jgi:hypothetical protein